MRQIEIISCKHEDLDNIDIFLCVSGDENRCSYLAKQFNIKDVKYKFAFQYDNIEKPQDYFQINDFIVIDVKDKNRSEIWNNLVKHLDHIEKAEINILIDYSSMSRMWYGIILKYMSEFVSLKKINLIFAYSIAKYIQVPQDLDYEFSPIPEFCNVSVPSKPTALIIGIGYEKRRAYSLKEYFDAEEVYVFRTNQSSAPDYYDIVSKNNNDLLQNIEQDHIFEYPIDNPVYTAKILFDLCDNLLRTYRLVIAPCGPKPFTVLSMLAAINFESIDVWRINSTNSPINKEADEHIIYTKISFPQNIKIKG